MRINKLIAAVATVAIVAAVTAAPASAQTKLKWAHVYETSEPEPSLRQVVRLDPEQVFVLGLQALHSRRVLLQPLAPQEL